MSETAEPGYNLHAAMCVTFYGVTTEQRRQELWDAMSEEHRGKWAAGEGEFLKRKNESEVCDDKTA